VKYLKLLNTEMSARKALICKQGIAYVV